MRPYRPFFSAPPRSTTKMTVAIVVGNGPLSDTDRNEINSLAAHKSAVVYRFNDYWNKNYESGEPVDVHVRNTKVHRLKKHGPNDVATVHIRTAENPFRRGPFGRCKTSGSKKKLSSGSKLIARLEHDDEVDSIEVYGMNWNFGKKDRHSASEGVTINDCCTKCSVHPTESEDYLPKM